MGHATLRQYGASFLSCLLALLGPTAAAALTFAQARDLVVSGVILPSANVADLVAYGRSTLLVSGDVVGSSDDPGSYRTITADTWFFWIDDDKTAHYAHATRFVFVDDATSTVSVENWEWWPAINGTEIWDTRQDRFNSPDVFFGMPPPQPPPAAAPPPALLRAAGFSRVCVYIISGEDDAVDTEFAKDKENMDTALTQYFGASNIHKKITRNNPTMTQVCDDFDDFADEAPACDKFVFFFTGHANETYLALRAHAIGTADRQLTGQKLADKLDDIPAPQWILIEACHAAAHVPPIDDARIEGHVITSAAADKKSYFDPEDGSYWVTHITQCMNDPAADGPDQGTEVSPAEAEAWAEQALNDSGDDKQAAQDSSIEQVHSESDTPALSPLAQATGVILLLLAGAAFLRGRRQRSASEVRDG